MNLYRGTFIHMMPYDNILTFTMFIRLLFDFFTQDVKVKVLPFLSSGVRHNTGVPPSILYCSMH